MRAVRTVASGGDISAMRWRCAATIIVDKDKEIEIGRMLPRHEVSHPAIGAIRLSDLWLKDEHFALVQAHVVFSAKRCIARDTEHLVCCQRWRTLARHIQN
jgi:hypothetical protein